MSRSLKKGAREGNMLSLAGASRRRRTSMRGTLRRWSSRSAHLRRSCGNANPASCSPGPGSRPRAASPTSVRRLASGRSTTQWSTRRSAPSGAIPSRCGSYALRFEVLTTAEPNAGHLALAELERRGLVSGVVTQNIDGLHERAGSREVVEVHGSIRTSNCLECGERVPLQEVVAALRDAPAAVPRCPRCGSILKPDVVMFGELLPPGAMERAVELAQGAGILLVVGSSLEVYPVAGLPEETISSGGALAIVNRGATPFDRLASIRIDGGAGETLAALARELLLGA